MKLDHTLTEAFKKFDLIAGIGSEETGEACAMTMLSWICGEEWSDHPPCAHRLIADIVVQANDAEGTTPVQRRELVRAGRNGVLDTWWIPTEVVVANLAGDDQTPFPSAMRVLRGIAAWKKAKERANLTNAYLTNAYLTNAHLTGANLTGANLTGANLTNAYLTGAYLTGAYLTNAHLTGANLTGAYLTGANLTNAYLTNAHLTGANLTRANLMSANFTNARGTPISGIPNGWELQNGLWTKA